MTPFVFARTLARLTARADELHSILLAASQTEYPEAKEAADALQIAVWKCRELYTTIKVNALRNAINGKG